jgi:hypothetical protein
MESAGYWPFHVGKQKNYQTTLKAAAGPDYLAA